MRAKSVILLGWHRAQKGRSPSAPEPDEPEANCAQPHGRASLWHNRSLAVAARFATTAPWRSRLGSEARASASALAGSSSGFRTQPSAREHWPKRRAPQKSCQPRQQFIDVGTDAVQILPGSRSAQFTAVVAINSALEIDVTGQVCADSLGDSPYSGIGGQHGAMPQFRDPGEPCGAGPDWYVMESWCATA